MLPGRNRLLLMLGALSLPATATAQAVPGAPLTHGMLAFDAKATLGAFTGVSTTMTGQLIGANVLSGVRGWVEAGARSLSSNNGHRDRDMAGSLESDKYPILRFDVTDITPGESRGDSIAVTLHGRFTIHGQTRDAAVPGWAWLRPTGARFRGALPVNVKDYGVGGLSKMLGVLKMNEMITVRMDVTFEK